MNLDELYSISISGINSVLKTYSKKGAKKSRSNRPNAAIILKVEGETVYTVHGKKYISDANHCIILPKSISYEWECTRSGHCIVANFSCQFAYDDIFSFSIGSSPKLQKRFHDLESTMRLKQGAYKAECMSILYKIISELLNLSNREYSPSTKMKKLASAVEYINNNYNKPLQNDFLSELVGVSTVYFRKLFTQAYGMSPINYLHNLRIKKAKEILQSDYSSISEVAQNVGYVNIYHFSHMFKEYTGLSPTEYVKSLEKNE